MKQSIVTSSFQPSSFRPMAKLLACAIGLSGCASYAPKIVLDETGLRTGTTTTASTINVFNSHYNSLLKDSAPAAAGSANSGVTSLQLTSEGSKLAYQFCSSFFKTSGTDQQYLLFSRDLLAAFGTLATGVLGATRNNQAATALIGLSSGALLSGISAYSRNFLFSEDNIQAVQDLTLKAMTAQTTAVLERARALTAINNYSIFDSVADIMDIQSICEVQKISSLVRNSIRQAEPSTTPGPGGKLTTDIGTQRAVNVSRQTTSAASLFLQSLDPALVLKAVKRVGKLDTYHDNIKSLATTSDIVTWTRDDGSDQTHITDIAKAMGWNGK